MSISLFLILTLLAEILGTIGGFGSSVVFVPLAGMFFDFKTVLGITGVLHVFSNLSKIALFGKHTNVKVALLLGVPGIIFVLLGAFLISHFFVENAELYLGIFLATGSILLLLLPAFRVEPTALNAISGGSLAGFLAGFFGTGGPVRALILTSFRMGKEAFIATSSFIDLGVDVGRSIIYLNAGFLDRQYYFYIPFLFLVSFIGSWIGKKILTTFTVSFFRMLVLLLVLAMGGIMIGKNFF